MASASRDGYDADVVVIGAGILGLATAMALAARHDDLRVLALEQESGVARHQSGNNSGVIHSGLYYRPGSAKARMAVAGAERMYAFCDEHGIAAERCGKVVVAIDNSELERMGELARRGESNGVPGIREVGPDELAALEPYAAGVRALHIPSTGIADYPAVCAKYRELLELSGGAVRLRSRVGAIRIDADGVRLATTSGEVRSRWVVNCGGLQADRLARRAGAGGATRDLRIVPFRGEYYDLKPNARHLLRNLIYPVPDPAFPFLGVHFTRRLDGSVEAGPNAVLALRREGYRWRDISLRDTAESLTWPGFLRLAANHWQTGAGEVWRSINKRAFVQALRRLMPSLEAHQLERGGAGVRAQALRRDGSLADDFEIASEGRMVHVLNAPSPGATASLLIGEEIAGIAERAWLGG